MSVDPTQPLREVECRACGLRYDERPADHPKAGTCPRCGESNVGQPAAEHS